MILSAFHDGEEFFGKTNDYAVTKENDELFPTGQVVFNSLRDGIGGDVSFVQSLPLHKCECAGVAPALDVHLKDMVYRAQLMDEEFLQQELKMTEAGFRVDQYSRIRNENLQGVWGNGMIYVPTTSDTYEEPRIAVQFGGHLPQKGDSGSPLYIQHAGNKRLLGILEGIAITQQGTFLSYTPVWGAWFTAIPEGYSLC